MFLCLFLFRRFHSDNSRINVQLYSQVSTKMVKDTLTDKTICQRYILNEFDLKIKNICPLFDWMSLSNQFIKLWNCFLTQSHFGRYWLLFMYYSPINFFILQNIFDSYSDNIFSKLTKLFHSKVNHKVNIKINVHISFYGRK